jgi:transketolase C-terminal domain/subunit
LNKHKVVAGDSLTGQETELQQELRRARVQELSSFCKRHEEQPEGEQLRARLLDIARQMHLDVVRQPAGEFDFAQVIGPVITRRAPTREKQIRYDGGLLPKIDLKKEYSSQDIVTAAMKIFARDSRVVSIDADLATTSGLEAGVGAVDQRRALNVGVAEANMMGIGEAFAALGYNTWISTFCPFYDWKVMRRVAVGHQERLESIASPTGWLSAGHGLDLTMLATASNFETRTNGATHMGNDDITIFDGLAHLKIIDVSCPQQLLAIMRWIMEGNRGLVYVRVMRTPSAVLYESDYTFEFGRGRVLRTAPGERAVIVSSGRGVHEALAAAAECSGCGVNVGVVDMPSIDEELLLELHNSGKLLFLAEQNNGYIWQNLLKILYRRRSGSAALDRIHTINTLTAEGKPQFIHSATYEELIEVFGLSPAKLVRTICDKVKVLP